MGRFSVWTDDQIGELDPNSDVFWFHWLIRRRSERPMGPVVSVRYIGGPFDGEVFNHVGGQPPERMDMMGKYAYILAHSEHGLEYRYKGPV